ncbi:hypothetical protein [Kineococcus sp. R86509]|uniref:DUF5983 family protein n=1 Tax=Kineococcus sp. R86509 TaxID=3093851 RepID=UPI0036D35E29
MIARYLDLSTAHLTQREAQSAAQELTTTGPRVIEHEYGLWVNVQHDDIEDEDQSLVENFPNLLAVIRYAREQGWDMNWVNFDRDSPKLPDLPHFTW